MRPAHLEQHVLKRDAALRDGPELAARVHEVGQRVLLVDGHQAVAQLVADGVQRDGQSHVGVVGGQPRDAWNDPCAGARVRGAVFSSKERRVCRPAPEVDTVMRRGLKLRPSGSEMIESALDTFA